MKNGKKRGEPGIIYHVSNVIGRELDYMWANDSGGSRTLVKVA